MAACLVAILMCSVAQVVAQPAPPPVMEAPISTQVEASLRADRTMMPVGSAVHVEFTLHNKSDEPVRLSVPGALVGKERLDFGSGLPLEHVFSAAGFRGLEISGDQNPQMGDRVARKPEYPVPPITLAPYATVGLKFDVSRFYPGLHQSGVYELMWRPYGGAIAAAPLTITIVQYKQVLLETDLGTMTIQLLYDKAPHHVANFLELIEKRYYNGKTLHLVYQNQFIMGGCPRGDGTGRRADGVTLPPEFNDTPFEVGTVGMALIEGDANSGSCQFFICLTRQPAWDGRYTAFAQVSGSQSLAVLARLGGLEVDPQHKPTKKLVIKSITAVDAPIMQRSNP
jgi:cyclophilin family peptidyl-prolyl cis-trans isomerase